MMQLSMKVGFGDEDKRKKELDVFQASIENLSEELESISGKYNEEEWQAYLLENCEGVKEMLEMVKLSRN